MIKKDKKQYSKPTLLDDTVIDIFRTAEESSVFFTYGGFSVNYKREVKALILNDYSTMYNSWLIDELVKEPDIPFGVVLTCYLRYCLFINTDTVKLKPVTGMLLQVLEPIFSLKSKEKEKNLILLLGFPMSKIHSLSDEAKNALVEGFRL